MELKGLGFSHAIGPLAETFGIRLSGQQQFRLLVHRAKRLARASAGGEFLHATEGLILESAQRGVCGKIIVERRALHQNSFDEPVPTYLDFPTPRRSDGNGLTERTDAEMGESDHVLVYSEIAKQSFVSNGVPAEKIDVCPLGTDQTAPGVDALRFSEPHGLLYIGSGSTIKGLDLAVAVVERLGRPFHLTVAGYMPDPVLDWLTGRESVTYEGLVSRSRLSELARKNALLLAPSKESFGLAALDAAVNGAHVLGLASMGLSEWLPDICGTFLSSRDPEPWVEAVHSLTAGGDLHEPDVRDVSSRAASELTWEHAGHRLAETYRKIMTHVR